MSNLFFIHTPFQLFVAQQVINQEKLTDNIMIFGYIGNNIHFLDIYDTIIIKDYWKKRYFIKNINSWSLFSFKNITGNYSRTYKERRYLNKIIRTNNVDTLFVGDANNIHYQLLSFYYSEKGYRICNFEEGSSHYLNSTHSAKFERLLIRTIKKVVSDLFFYIPIWKMPFGRNVYIKNIDYNSLPFSKRYSIMPFYNEKCDVRLTPQLLVSDKVRAILDKEVGSIQSSKSILFLSEPVDEVTPLKYQLELLSIKQFFSSNYNGETITIKFHPREGVDKQNDVLEVFESLNIPYVVISKDINIPIEYYLQSVKYRKIITYLCSAIVYNGYLYPKAQLISLLPIYYRLCLEHKSGFTQEVEKILSSALYKKLFDDGQQ